ncbi:NAD(P)H-dependent oxidoreductase [Paenibacillus sp. 2TAB19]|uniref:NAD(P)H-dependent oxidoreductase n=1 Tax=Paenibacillus sp. 2TAB19 TaxID=3233003 RepID=UPI003F95868A
MNIMIIAVHPHIGESRVNRALAVAAMEETNVTYRDLSAEYPGWDIDAEKEHQLLLAHDRIVLQFPLYWYSSPPLLKKWFDDVLTYGWAYGPGGNHLHGKEFAIATTAGGTWNSYRSGGDNEYTLSELFRPIERTIKRCGGTYLPSFEIYGAMEITDDRLKQEAANYVRFIQSSALALAH